jgi:hypothetical protein
MPAALKSNVSPALPTRPKYPRKTQFFTDNKPLCEQFLGFRVWWYLTLETPYDPDGMPVDSP